MAATVSLKNNCSSIKTQIPHSNLDYWYGPYDSVLEAKLLVPIEVRGEGLTVGVKENGTLVEYLWKKGTTNDDLVPKIDDYFLEIEKFKVNSYEEEEAISFTYKVNGKGLKVQMRIYLGTKLVHSLIIDLNLELETVKVLGPKNPDKYTYTCVVTDSVFGTTDSLDGDLSWKDIDVTFSYNPFNISVKSLDNIRALTNKTINFKAYASDKVTNLLILVIKNDGTLISTIDTITVNSSSTYQYTVDTSALSKGDTLKIKVTGDIESENRSVEKEFTVVLILSDGYLDFEIFEVVDEKVYKGHLFLVRYYYKSENEEYLTFDINFEGQTYSSSIKSYLEGTIKLTPTSSGSKNIILSKNESEIKRITVNVIDVSETLTPCDYTDPSNINITNINSYAVELKCTIPYFDDLDTKVFEFGDISIYPQYISFGGLKYPTFQGLDVTFGFLYHVEENTHFFNAITVNGCVCSKEVIDENNIDLINLSSANHNDIGNITFRLYPEPSLPIELLQNNYKAEHPSEFTGIEYNILELTPLTDITLDDNKYIVGTFGEFNGQKYGTTVFNDLCTILGLSGDSTNSEIKKAVKKAMDSTDTGYNPTVHENYVRYLKANCQELSKQTVGLKNFLQKYITVPCQVTYNNEDIGYALVFTLGTSTLTYRIPNFTFKFYDSNAFSGKNYPSIIPKMSRRINDEKNGIVETNENSEYYEALELVAKVDYMEESHLNNTPTAMYYNMLTLEGGITELHTEGGLNAIEGTPIILKVNGVNYGSFMLNLPKASSEIYFGENGISLEVTSNSDFSGYSGAFMFSNNDIAKGIDIAINNTNVNSLELEVNSAIADFLNDGLEYRYSNAKADLIGDDLEEYRRILKMWKWVYDHENYTLEDFEEVFNFESCALYFIQMMVFGQTDNFRKNMMIDQFEADGKWFIRPYDMDSLAGLDNNGYDIYPPFIEMNKLFTLDTSSRNTLTVPYLGSTTSRFPFTANNSNLWVRFYNNLQLKIETFYQNLRNAGYSSETIIDLCYKNVISKLDITLYNEDFKVKYLENEAVELQFVTGNRWIRFKDWIKKRFDFCDVYFSYSGSNEPGGSNGSRYLIQNWPSDYRPVIEYAMPLYTITQYADVDLSKNYYWGNINSETAGVENFSVGTGTKKTYIWFAPLYILKAPYLFEGAVNDFTPKVRLDYLVSFDGSYSNLSSIDLSNNNIILDIQITGNITDSQLNDYVPSRTKKLTILESNSITLDIILPGYIGLEELVVSNSKFNKLRLYNCENIKKISILSSTINELELVQCGKENVKIDLIINSSKFIKVEINNSNIQCIDLSNQLLQSLTFSGENSNVNTLCLYKSTINTGILDIEHLTCLNLVLNNSGEIRILYTSNKTFLNLGLENSQITLFGGEVEDTDKAFNGNCITTNTNSIVVNDSTLISVLNNLKSGIYTNQNSFPAFRLKDCPKIEIVKNITYALQPICFFYNCNNLKTILNCNLTLSPTYAFTNCYNLNTITNCTFHFPNTETDANSMFRACSKLSWNLIKNIIGNDFRPTSCNEMFYCKGWNENTTIELDYFSEATNLSRCFSLREWSNNYTYPNENIVNDVTIEFIGKLPKVTNLHQAFALGRNKFNNYTYVLPEEVFSTNTSTITDAEFCFFLHNNNFTLPKLPAHIEKLRGFCMGCQDLTLPSSWKVTSDAVDCASMFYDVKFSSETDVYNLFSECTKLENLTNCFRSCKYCNCSLKLTMPLNTASVNIGGIFANAKIDNSDPIEVPYDFNIPNGKWYSNITNLDYRIGTSATYSPVNDLVGPYYGIILNGVSTSLTLDAETTFHGLFDNATINSSELSLTIKCKDCYRLCRNTKLSSNSSIKATLIGVESAVETFKKCGYLHSVNASDSKNTLLNATKMFAGSNISTTLSDFSDYTHLQIADYMYGGCILITSSVDTLKGTKTYFLPSSLTSVIGMFAGCYITGGIVVTFDDNTGESTGGFINSNNNITDISELFAATRILGSTESTPQVDFSKIFPNAKIANGTLLFTSAGGNNYIQQEISLNCFKNCTSCKNLFAGSDLNLNANMDFLQAKYLNGAFASGRNVSSTKNIVDIKISSDVDVRGLCKASTNYKQNEVQSHVDDILSKLKNLNIRERLGALENYTVGLESDIAYAAYNLTSIMINPLNNWSFETAAAQYLTSL